MSRTSSTTTLRFEDDGGRLQVREINHVIDIRDYLGCPGYPLLLMAANCTLSITDLLQYLWHLAYDEGFPAVKRTRSWIRRRRWLFQQPGTTNALGPRSDYDGKHDRAVAVMAMNQDASLRALRKLLAEHGIERSVEWVRRHRYDGATQ